MPDLTKDAAYCEELLAPVRKCALYRPKFGAGMKTGAEEEVEMNVDGFRRLYGADPLYAWLGLDSPLMYAAHKAAAGMTSIYRQLGIGCERLVRAVLGDTLGLSRERMLWAYETVDEKGKKKTLTLDAKIDAADLRTKETRVRFKAWLGRAGTFVERPKANALVGVVFEVRQGYKSADSNDRTRIWLSESEPA